MCGGGHITSLCPFSCCRSIALFAGTLSGLTPDGRILPERIFNAKENGPVSVFKVVIALPMSVVLDFAMHGHLVQLGNAHRAVMAGSKYQQEGGPTWGNAIMLGHSKSQHSIHRLPPCQAGWQDLIRIWLIHVETLLEQTVRASHAIFPIFPCHAVNCVAHCSWPKKAIHCCFCLTAPSVCSFHPLSMSLAPNHCPLGACHRR